MRILAITTLRNEASFLLEWLAHHRHIGFTDFLIFTNDCSDGTDLMVARLQEMGLAHHVANPGPWAEGPQWAALKAASRHPLYHAADWAMVLDIDEFVNVQVGDGSLAQLFAAAPDVDFFPMTWRLFGNAGVARLTEHPITETFTRCAPRVLHWPWRALMVKTLYRRAAFEKPGVHRPKGEVTTVKSADPSLGARLLSAPGRDPYKLVQLNHYALGAMDSYILKCDRGRANRQATALDMAYWCDRNFCADEDRSIARIESTALRQELCADPQLYGLHRASLGWRRHRFAELMREESTRALFGRLLMTPASRPLSATEAEFIRRHNDQSFADQTPFRSSPDP